MEITFNPKRGKRKFHFDISALSLVISNFIIIVIALIEHWEMAYLMWIYWGQSVTIGVFTFIKILSLENFSTEGFKINNREVAPTRETKHKIAFFFLIHYGGFHLVYFFFLLGLYRVDSVAMLEICLCIGIFVLNHGLSFFHNWKRERYRQQNIGTVMSFPYVRIIPMHLTIILGNFLVKSTGALLLFLILKILADLAMHMEEHAQPVDEEAL